MDGHVFQSFRPMVFRELAAAVERPTSVSQGCDGRFVDWKWLNIYRLGNNMLEYILILTLARPSLRIFQDNGEEKLEACPRH